MLQLIACMGARRVHRRARLLGAPGVKFGRQLRRCRASTLNDFEIHALEHPVKQLCGDVRRQDIRRVLGALHLHLVDGAGTDLGLYPKVLDFKVTDPSEAAPSRHTDGSTSVAVCTDFYMETQVSEKRLHAKAPRPPLGNATMFALPELNERILCVTLQCFTQCP